MRDRLIPEGGRVAVAGAGCAGISLAIELAESRPDIGIDVFDRGDAYPTDRTWCSWSVTPNRFDRVVSDRWSRVRVRGGARDTTIDASRYPYVCIQGDDFFQYADELLDQSGTVSIHRRSAVVNARESNGHVTVDVERSIAEREERRYDMLFDGRSCKPVAAGVVSEPSLVQHFGGIEIETPDGLVDRETVTLMDFSVPQDQGAHFMYVLPYSRGTTLLESTFLTPPGHESVDYESYALEYAERHFGIRSPRIVDRESGALPMTLGPLGAGATRRIWPIGTRAGVGRASSGYAFDAIQRDSAQVIAALGRNTSRPRPPRSPLLSLLDRVLISWLSEDQSAAPRVFGDLFAKSPPKSLIRFLADVPTLFDLWSTMWSMPKLETSLHAVTHPRAWPRLS